MAVLVETAVTNFTLKLRGINSAKEFDERIIKYLQKKKQEEENK